MKQSRFLAAACLALAVSGCVTQTTVVDESEKTGGTGGGGVSGPSTPGCEAAVRSVRVNPFGYDCDDSDSPNNSSGLLPLGCVARVTATPKDQTGRDVPDTVHGPNISWAVTFGGSHVEVVDDPSQPFNKNVRAVSVGEFSLSATVCGVTGAWNGRVVPPID